MAFPRGLFSTVTPYGDPRHRFLHLGFDAHLPYMEGFRKRCTAGNGVCRTRAGLVSSQGVEAIAPSTERQ